MNSKQIPNKDMELIFDQISKIVNRANNDSIIARNRLSSFKKEIFYFKPKDISWNNVCAVATTHTARLYFLLIVILLESETYNADHSKALYRLLPEFILLVEKEYFGWKKILCGNEIEDFVIVPQFLGDFRNSYYIIKFENEYIKEIYRNFLFSGRKSTRSLTREQCLHFEMSIGILADNIRSSTDFNDSTFWKQINYFKEIYKDNRNERDKSIKTVISFYRYLVNSNPDHHYFENSVSLTDTLLFSNNMTLLVQNDYHFMLFNPHDKIEDKIRYVIILKGLNKHSTGLRNEDSVSFNLSDIQNSFFRVEIMNYLIKGGVISYFISNSIWVYIKSVIIFFEQLKSQPNYPNPTLTHFTTEEAILLKNYLNDERIKLSSRNNRIGAARRFLMWGASSNKFTFENMFFDYLSQYEEPSKPSGKAVPDKDLVLLNNLLKQKSHTDHVAKLCYSIFHLCIQTEFRISQICHLTVDCIRPSIKPNQYIVTSNSKTSYGRKNEYIITNLTYRHLMDIINETEPLRVNSAINSMSNYIFLYNAQMNSTGIMSSQKFAFYLVHCCKELGFSRNYTAANLRDTHMTKAFEYVLRNGKSDVEMSILSKHKRLDTTKNHYIEMELEKMLESTYGIIIGNSSLIQAEKNIVDKIPAEASAKSSIVENGCGNCKTNSCVQMNPLPCLACEHFVTTVAHEKYFIKAIEGVELSIVQAKTPHDKDDLNTIKLLYVLYLKAIYIHKETQNHDRS